VAVVVNLHAQHRNDCVRDLSCNASAVKDAQTADALLHGMHVLACPC
jgi:hypothetical protein